MNYSCFTCNYRLCSQGIPSVCCSYAGLGRLGNGCFLFQLPLFSSFWQNDSSSHNSCWLLSISPLPITRSIRHNRRILIVLAFKHMTAPFIGECHTSITLQYLRCEVVSK